MSEQSVGNGAVDVQAAAAVRRMEVVVSEAASLADCVMS